MSKMNIKPLADRVLVEASEAETKTSSGIIIPDTAKEKPQRGKIVAVVEPSPASSFVLLATSLTI